MPSITTNFEVTGWDEAAYDEPADGPRLARVTVKKNFSGEMEGESTAELLMCQADLSDYNLGAGFVGSEVFVGRIGDKEGSFVMQHGGVSGGGQEPYTFGAIIPGSATGELKGLTGNVEFDRTPEGQHLLKVTYDFTE